MPFLNRAGLGDGVDKFDFSVPGVTSISCDIASTLISEFYHLLTVSTSMPSVPRVSLSNADSELTNVRRVSHHVPICRAS